MSPVINYHAIAEQWLPRIIAEDPTVTSADKAYTAIRDRGIDIRREPVREVWRETIRAGGYPAIVDMAGDEFNIPRSWYFTTTQQYGDNYAYQVRIQGQWAGTDIIIDQIVNVTSPSSLQAGEIRDTATELAVEYGIDVSLPSYQYNIVGMEHVRGRPW